MGAADVIPSMLFDDLRDAVVECCKDRYWDMFTRSPYFLKLLKVCCGSGGVLVSSRLVSSRLVSSLLYPISHVCCAMQCA
jgi:hypothetical protein